jgi:hypothetical protein
MHVFPSSSPRPTPSEAEKALYAALAKCTELDWHAFHSLRLRTPDGWEGEGDFVLANPAGGLLVLEVKGGRIELRDGLWLQNGRPLTRPPRDQAQGFVRRLKDELERAGLEAPPYGVACVFPDSEFSGPPTSGDLRGLVLGARDLPHLSSVLPDVFSAAVPRGRVPASRRWVQHLASLWGATWVPSVRLTDRVEDAAARSVALDAQQYAVLEFAGDTPRALVEGPAGSGKTLVATELCRRRARAGQRTLYLCFTDALARAVSAQFEAAGGEGPRPRATSIRQFAVDLLRQRGLPIPPPDKAFWDEVSFNAAAEALPTEADRPQLVVVDEGQDFETSDWMLVEQLAGPRGLWVFRDQRQAFWSERTLPASLEPTLAARLKLQQRYRCPAGLAAFAECFATDAVPPAAPPVDEVRLVEAPADETGERVRHLLDELRRQGAKPSDIAIVTLAGQSRSALYRQPRLGSHALVHGDAPDAHQHIVMETFLRFKGLERPFVIVCETAGAHLTRFTTRMHIGLTRATVAATVVAPRERVDADPRLALLRSSASTR